MRQSSPVCDAPERPPAHCAARARVAGIASFLPPDRLSSTGVEQIVNRHSAGYTIRPGIVAGMSGVCERRVAAPDTYGSHLAGDAARSVLDATNTLPAAIDLLIYASAGQDLVEPATANIVQELIGTSCPVFDLKNACNSFLNGMQVAESLIAAGSYRCILVVAGETPSRAIQWRTPDDDALRNNFAGYTMGDAGAAALLVPSADGHGIIHFSFATQSRHWEVATIAAGGSRHPRGDEWTYLQGDGTKLKDAFLALGPDLLHRAFCKTATTWNDYACILVHQVSTPFLKLFAQVTGAPRDRIESTLPMLGNMAAATLPVGYAQAYARGAIRPGDLVLWIGLAGGISMGVMIMEA